MTGSGIRHDATRSTVLRAAALLEVFRPEDVELGLAELMNRSGLPKSTVFRIADDLVHAGFLERGPVGYRLGLKLFELGHLVPLHRKLREVGMPYLTDLHEATGLTTNLAVRDGREVVYVEKLGQLSSPVPHTRTGGRLPLHCTGLGKAILAFSAEREITAAIAQPLLSLTPYSLVDPDELRRDLAEIRRTRLAYDDQESEPGLFCVASPIVGKRGVVGAISATGDRKHVQSRQVSLAVLTAGRGLSRLLGGLPPART